MENEKKYSWKEILRLYRRAIRDMNRFSPGFFQVKLLQALLRGLSPYATVWLSAQLVNELAGACRREVLWMWVCWTVGVTAGLGLLRIALNRWEEKLDTLHDARKERIFTDKFFDMDYADVDDQKVRDRYKQIRQNENWADWGYNQAVYSLPRAVEGLLSVCGALGLTVSLFTARVTAEGWQWLNSPLPVAILVGLMVLLQLLTNRWATQLLEKNAALAEEATMGNRLWTAVCKLRGASHRSLDSRTYQQDWIIDRLNRESRTFVTGGSFDRLMRGPYGIRYSFGQSLSAVLTGFVYVFACCKAWAGAIAIGSVTQYVGAVTAMNEGLAVLLEHMTQLRNNAPFLENIFTFLDTPNAMYQGSLTTEKRSDRQYEVEFRNVSFQYPGSDRWALRNVSMRFRVGSRLAVVGENGSGKTTFIKLLCRLYDPQEGQILLNGIDICKYNYRDYMDIFSVVFQDFQLLSQPLGANVAGSGDYDRERARRALVDTGFGDRLETMPQGLDTQLYKEFMEDGVEVSGGEAQKIAIARALYKDAPFIVLDEPTAALDPVAEAEIYSKFNDIAGDKTAIYISHRLSSCKFCDEIAVFQAGTVVQKGTHEELLGQEGGPYQLLWNAQAQYYTRQPENGEI